METDGEGGGGEAGRRGIIELRRLLEAIESSKVVEKRIPLIKQLEGSSQFSADDLGLVLQVLLASWIDSTCSGVSHCTLHKSILQVALKCSDLDITDYHLRQLLALCAKASSWCEKHPRWSVKSIDGSQVLQEEGHNSLCLELNSLPFILSTKLLGIAKECLTELGLGAAAVQGAHEKCVLNKADDAFPVMETMALEPPTQKGPRRCMHCGSQKTPRWLPGPDGPGTLCNACGLRFSKGRLLDPNPRRSEGHPSNKRCPSKENGNDVAVLVEVPSENGHDMAMGSWSLAPLPQEAPRRCTHCGSQKTPRWLWGPDGPCTLCNACGLRFYKGQLLNSYSSRRRGRPSKKRRPSKENSNDVAVLVEVESENGHDIAMAPWSLAPVPQEASRRCTHCATEKTSRWLRGPDGPGTLCNACGQRFKKGRLLQSNSGRCQGRRSSSMQNSAAGDSVAALVEALSCGVGTSLDTFFEQMGLDMSWEEAGPEQAAEEEEELEWLSNKDAFPSVETMGLEVEEAPAALDALPAAARTKGQRRVTAMETCRHVPPAEKKTVVSAVLPRRRRRCTHCATEETPAWRVGPEGPYTLCNPCGLVFRKKGQLPPEYRPANSPAFSRLLHSNRYSRALEMHRQNKTSATAELRVELLDGQANGPTSSPLQRCSSLRRVLQERHQSEEETSVAGHATAEAGRGKLVHESMEVPLLSERPPADSPAFSLVSHRRVLKRGRKSEQDAVIRATTKPRRAERAVASLAAMDN